MVYVSDSKDLTCEKQKFCLAERLNFSPSAVSAERKRGSTPEVVEMVYWCQGVLKWMWKDLDDCWRVRWASRSHGILRGYGLMTRR